MDEKFYSFMTASWMIVRDDCLKTAWRLPNKYSPKIDHKIVSNIEMQFHKGLELIVRTNLTFGS